MDGTVCDEVEFRQKCLLFRTDKARYILRDRLEFDSLTI